MSPPNASVSAVSAHAVASIVGSAKNGRLGAVGLFKRFPSVARRPASADSYPTASACHLGSFVFQPRGFNASVALSPFSPLRGPTHRSRGRCAMKPRSAPELKRWGAESMRHFASSHIQPFALSPMRLVLPVRKVSAVPSFPRTRRFAAASASCWRPLRGAPLEASAQVRPSRGQTSACVVGRGAIASVGRPLLLGRLARVTQIRRVPSSAHRGRRIASADSCATLGSVRRPCLRFSHPHCTLRAGACACGARIAGEPQRPNPSLQGTLRDEAAQRP